MKKIIFKRNLFIILSFLGKKSSNNSSFIRNSFESIQFKENPKINSSRFFERSYDRDQSSFRIQQSNYAINENNNLYSSQPQIDRINEFSNLTNNPNNTKHSDSIDNLLINDNPFKKSDKCSLRSLNNDNVENHSTFVVSEMINQISRFQNYVNEEQDNEKFRDKSEEFYRNMKSNSNNLLNSNLNNNNVPNFINLKISHVEKKSMQIRVFWNKEKMEDMRKKFRMAKEKIKIKTEIFLKKIQDAIKKGDREKIL